MVREGEMRTESSGAESCSTVLVNQTVTGLDSAASHKANVPVMLRMSE
jgi:hypothetical protein